MSIQTQLTQLIDEATKAKLKVVAKELDMFNAAFELWVDNTIACDLYSVMFHPDGRITGVRSNMNGHYIDEPNAKQYLLDCYTKHTNAKISTTERAVYECDTDTWNNYRLGIRDNAKAD